MPLTICRLRRLLAALALALPLLGQAHPDSSADKLQGKLPAQELTGQILYQVLLAEIAANRGSLQIAASAYGELARSTRDPRVARRATEISIYARQPEPALEMARLWVSLDPASPQARQTLIGLLLAAKRIDEVAPQLSQLLSQDSGRLTEILPQLNHILARYPDKLAVARVIEQVTQMYEDTLETHLARAQAYLAAGDDGRALAAAERAIVLRPDSEQAVLLKAEILRKTSPAQALDVLRGHVQAYPQAREVRLAYARVLVLERQFEPARREYQALLQANKGDYDAAYAVALLSLQVNDLATAEREFKSLLDIGFSDVNVVRLYLGQIAEESKKTEEALHWYALVTPGEQYLPAQARAANLLAREGQLEEGRALLRRAAAASPKEDVSFLVAEAQLLTDAGRIAAAFDLLSDRLAAQPEEPQLLYESALLAEKLGRHEVLETNMRLLIRLKPEHAHAYNALGYSLAERNLRLDEAQQLIEKALSLAPNDAFILDSKGWVLYRRGDNGAALDFLQKAYRQRPDPEIAAHLGEVLWVLGRHDEAEKTWNAARSADPRNEVLAATIRKFQH